MAHQAHPPYDADDSLPSDSLSFERRHSDRSPYQGDVVVTYRTPTGRAGITRLSLCDRSPTGLGGFSRTRIEPGSSVSICSYGHILPGQHATAVRCLTRQEEHRVGLLLSRKAAA